MNILEVPITEISQNPVSPSQPNKSSDILDGFNALFSSLVSELKGSDQALGLSPESQAKLNLMLLMGLDQTSKADGISADSLKDSFAKLGDKLLELMTKLLAGIQTDGQIDGQKNGLLPTLDDVINSLALTKDDANAQNILIKLLADMKQEASSGGLQDKLGKLVDGLPEATKLKIRLIANKAEHLESGQEMDISKFKLLINLLGLEDPNRGKGNGALPGASDAAITYLKEMLMERFHIKPDAANGQAALVKDGVPSGQEAAQSEGTRQNGMSSTGTAVDSIAMHAANGNGNDPKNINLLTDNIHVQDTKPEGVDTQQVQQVQQTAVPTASAKDISEATMARHEATNLASAKEVSATQVMMNSRGPSNNSDDTKDSTKSTGNRFTYGYGVENSPSFATEVAQKALSITGGQGFDANPGINNPGQLIKQIVERFDVLISGTKSEASIQLKPRYLGDLKIHLIVEGGSIKAVLDASTHQAKHLLEVNLTNLKQSLEDQGLKIKEISVSVGHHQENHGKQPGRQHHGRSVGYHGRAIVAKEVQGIKSRLSLGSDMAVNYLA